MNLRLTNKVKLGGLLGAAVVLSLPFAAQASTSTPQTAPLAAVSTNTVTSVVTAAGSVTAPLTGTTAPKTSGAETDQMAMTPEPAGSAEAYAANVAGIVGISHTSASASGTRTSSTADPLELAGNPPAAQFGGTQNGPGSNSNALVDTGPSSQFRLELTPWSVTNKESGGQNTASAIADILILDLGDQATAESASLRLLQSTSDASWNSNSSTGKSTSDGAILTLGGPSGLDVDLLHADANSSGQGSSYLLSVNGTEIGSSDQASGQCALSLPPLVTLDCLTASGGTANGVSSEASGVLSVILGSPPAGADIGLVQTKTAGSAPSVSSDTGGQQGSNGGQQGSNGGQSGGSGGQGGGAAGQPSGSGALAFTGSNVATFLLAALMLGLLGAFLVWTTRRLRAGAA